MAEERRSFIENRNENKKMEEGLEQDTDDAIKKMINNEAVHRLSDREKVLKFMENDDAAKIKDLINKDISLVSKLLEEKAECDKLQDRYFNLQHQCYNLRNEKIQLIQEIGELNKQLEESEENLKHNNPKSLEQLNGSLHVNLSLSDTIRNIFQKLIHGSGVNWVTDEDLKYLTMELGDDPFEDDMEIN